MHPTQTVKNRVVGFNKDNRLFSGSVILVPALLVFILSLSSLDPLSIYSAHSYFFPLFVTPVHVHLYLFYCRFNANNIAKPAGPPGCGILNFTRKIYNFKKCLVVFDISKQCPPSFFKN